VVVVGAVEEPEQVMLLEQEMVVGLVEQVTELNLQVVMQRMVVVGVVEVHGLLQQ
tara:strand:+ start:409 stop:573 length:165 start_codon:yes stop_codon:yes gene_type:complete